MNKNFGKRTVAFLLALLMMLGTIAGTDFSSVLASGALFTDDFSSANLSGWNSTNTGTVSSGKYYLSNQESNIITKVPAQSKLMISANVAVNQGANEDGLLQNSIASVVAMANKDMTKGYEFGIGVTKTGVTYARLYLRGDESTSRILVQEYSIPGVEIKVGKTYRLTLGVYEGLIQCFIGAENATLKESTLAISFKDSTYTSGLCGIKTAWSKSAFDNVAVSQIEEKKVEKLTLVNDTIPTKVSMVGELDFDVTIEYVGDYHQDETVSSNDSRLTITGFARKVGDRTVRVSYGGKTAKFKTTVVKSLPDTEVFSDNFSNFNKDNYALAATTREKYNVKYAFNAENGMLKATVPALPAGYDQSLTATARIDKDSLNALKNYYASVDAVLYSDMQTPTTRRAIAELSAFTDLSGQRYRFRVYSTGNVKLYRESTLIFDKKIASIEGASFTLGKSFNMAMHVTEGMLVCQYNGKDVFYYAGADMTEYTPKVIIRAINGNVSFDNLKVYGVEKYSKDAVKNIKIKSISTNDTISSCTGRSIDVSKYYLLVTYVNGVKKPVRLTEDMLVGYNPNLKKTQNITVTYGKKTATLKFIYTEYLFYDTFEKTMSESWNFSTAENLKLKIKKSALRSEWTRKTTDASVSGYVEGSDEWTNYSASVDVAFDTSMTKNINSGSYVSLMLRRTGSTYYDLRFITRGGKISMTLYEYIDGESEPVVAIKNSALAGMLKSGADKELANGQNYTIKAICKDDTIYFYVNDVAIGSYKNASENAPRKGRVGMKVSKCNATIDNFIVQEKGPLNMVKLEVDGLKDNVFEIYEGFEIEAYDYTLKCYDKDGTVMSEVLTADMISPYDNLEAGLQNIVISAHGLKQKAAVRVLQRDDYIKQVEKDLKALKVSKLTVSDVDKVDDILDRFDELSAFEVSKMAKKAAKNATKARQKVESLRYPEIAKDDVIYTNTFTKKSECNDTDWYNGSEAANGEWLFINGTYRNEQEYYGLSDTSHRVVKDLYGEISSVSARFQVLSPGMFAGVLLNVNTDGEYSARLKMNVFDENNEVIPMFQVLKGDTILISEELSNYGVHISENEWFDVRLTYAKGIVSAYFNDTMVFSFDDSEEIINYTEGRAGVMLSRANGKFDNFIVRGVEKEVPKSVAKPTPTEYKDDFQDEKANSNPNYWVEGPLVDDWKVVAKGDNLYYGTQGKDTEVNTWLHVFEKDPTVSMDFMYDAKKTDSDIGFYIRKSPDTAYVKIGYDTAIGKWYVVETQAARDCEINTTYSEKIALKGNIWHKLQIVASDKYVTVKVDGKAIFDKLEVSQIGHGRIGAYSTNSALYVDNVKMDFPNGDIPQDGIIEYKISNEFYDAGVDLQVLNNGDILGLGIYGSYYSKDGGKSFDIIGGASADDEDVNPKYEELTSKQGYNSMLRIHDGSILLIHNTDYVVNRSTDEMNSWKGIGRVVPEDYLKDKQGRRNVTTHNNSLTEVQLEDGTWRLFMPVGVCVYDNQLATGVCGHYTEIYYSDDGGVTWTRSKTDSRELSIDTERVGNLHEWAETKIIQCSDGTLRLYLSRSKYGCMQYSESRDGGVTWEMQQPMPEQQVAKSSFSIVQDKEDNTYYMVFVNNNPTRMGATFNRTRLTLMHSKDGKKWDFVCDLERMTDEVYSDSHTNPTPLMQLVDPSLETDNKYVYVTVGVSTGSDITINSASNHHNSLRPTMYRIEKDKLNARAWDASTVNDMMFVKSLEVTKAPKIRFGYGDLFSYIDGEVTATRLDGTTDTIDTARMFLYEEPDMFTLGKQTVLLYNANGTQVSYEIEVVKKYNVNWRVTGEGTIEPQVNGVLEGDGLKVAIKPVNFFQKAIVTVNGEKVHLRGGKLIMKEVVEDLDITVDFVQKGVLDYLFYASFVLLIGLGGTVGVLYYKKKKATKKDAVTEE